MHSPLSPPLHTVHFGFGDDQIDHSERRLLEDSLRSIGHSTLIALAGFTDDIGPVEYNNALALRRAESVRAVLIEAGFQANQIIVQGRGRTDYVATNESKRERARNRRVEIRYQGSGPMFSDEDQQPVGNDPHRVGRYSMRSFAPLESQKNPLDAVVKVVFPDTIKAVGAALEHLIERSGWRLAEPPNSDPTLATLVRLALPDSQRTFGPIRMLDAIKGLCGDAYRVVVDPVHRLISCELRDPYAKYWSDNHAVASVQ